MIRSSTIVRVRPAKARKPLPRTKRTPLAQLMRQADRLAGELCRRRGKCESCGTSQNLQWAHIISRTYKGLRWDEDNCLALCAPCHARFTYRPSQWIAWLMKNIPARYLLLERRSREIHKPNRWEMQRIIDELQANLEKHAGTY